MKLRITHSPSHSTPLGPIIGGSIGGFIFLCVIISLIVFLYRRRRARKSQYPDQGPSSLIRLSTFDDENGISTDSHVEVYKPLPIIPGMIYTILTLKPALIAFSRRLYLLEGTERDSDAVPTDICVTRTVVVSRSAPNANHRRWRIGIYPRADASTEQRTDEFPGS